MKILVSACLLGENCKYSGGNNYNQAVCDFARGHQVVPVCPEVLGGLPTPRCPAEIVQGVVTNKEGINVDREFRAGAAKALAIAKENGVELAILQSRSPSCGVKEIYDGTFSGTKIPGQGVFAKMLMDEGVRVLDAGELPKIILKNKDGKMSIRLICSDIDGTLLQYGKKELEDEIFEQIRELHRRGILFCPASGRQYTSLRKLFAPVADCCVFLCENGGVIYKDEQCMDYNNLRNMARFVGGDPEHKVSLLMDHTRRPGDVADPWYTGDFEATWQDVLEGCTALLEELR